MTIIFSIILGCSIIGPMGLCLGVTSRYSDMRLLFASVAVLCAFLMGSLFGTFFGTDILQEIVMSMLSMPEETGL